MNGYTCPNCGNRGDYWQARAEKAEAAVEMAQIGWSAAVRELARLRDGIQALADEWESYNGRPFRPTPAALRGLLFPTPEGTP